MPKPPRRFSGGRSGATGRQHSPRPDLVLRVREEQLHGQNVLSFRLLDRKTSTAAAPEYGPVKLRLGPLDYFEELYTELEDLSPDKRIAEQRLEVIGTQLFRDLLPQELRQRIWEMREDVHTVQVVSDEPWIPWEMLKLQGEEHGRSVSGPFFGEAFAITRWLRGHAQETYLPSSRMALVVTEDSDLSGTTDEREQILALADRRRSVQRIAPRYLAVKTALASGHYDAWHFAGHGIARGRDPNRWSIQLENYESLRPEDLNADASNLGAARPLVFFNGCHTGRGAFSLTGVGGWAKRFLDAGAGAFIGAQWAIPDEQAAVFSKAFYRNFLAGAPIGEAVRQARLEVRKYFPADPSWLAYTAFAHPLASCQAPLSRTPGRRWPRAALAAAFLLAILPVLLIRLPLDGSAPSLPIEPPTPSETASPDLPVSGEPVTTLSPPGSSVEPSPTPEPPEEKVEDASGTTTRPDVGNFQTTGDSPKPAPGRNVTSRTRDQQPDPIDIDRYTSLQAQAKTALGEGDSERAIELLEQAISFRPEGEEALKALAVILRQNKRYREAERYFRELLKLYPRNDSYEFNLYDCQIRPWLEEIDHYSKNQQYDEALAVAQKILGLDPPSAPMGNVAVGLAYVWRNWDSTDQVSAAKHLRDALAQHKSADSLFRLNDSVLAGVHNGLGLIYARQGDLSNAKGSFVTAIQLDRNGDYPEIRRNLELVMQQRFRDEELDLGRLGQLLELINR